MRAEDLSRLQTDLESCAPVRGLAVASLDDGVLLLIAHNAAVASKVRQFEPSLVAGLSRSGWKITKIKVRPQPTRYEGIAPAPRSGADKPPIPEQALDDLSALAREVEQGPLQDALNRLVARRRRVLR